MKKVMGTTTAAARVEEPTGDRGVEYAENIKELASIVYFYIRQSNDEAAYAAISAYRRQVITEAGIAASMLRDNVTTGKTISVKFL